MKNFFIKHKTKLLILLLVIAAASLLTAVTIALWNSDEDIQIIYNPVVNPDEKYFEYYAVVENASATDGFDYYPLSRVPSSLVTRITGLALVRYTGFSNEVVIPEEASININGSSNGVKLPVTHIINNYSQTLGNNLGSNIKKLVIPRSVIYVEEGALTNVEKIIVDGNLSDMLFEFVVSKDQEGKYPESYEIKSSDGLVVDTLELYNENQYLSTNTLELYKVSDGYISYIYPALELLFDEVSYEAEALATYPISGLNNYDNVVMIDENRKNTVTYSLTKTNSNTSEVETIQSGYMISPNGNYLAYHRYVVIYEENTTLTVGGITYQENLPVGKYYVAYLGGEIAVIPVTYYIESVIDEEIKYTKMELDSSFTDYERYVSDIELKGNEYICEQIGEDEDIVQVYEIPSYTGTYEVTYAPDVVFTDLASKTQVSVNEIYYAYNVSETQTPTNSVSFILPDLDNVKFYAHFTKQLVSEEAQNDEILQLYEIIPGLYSCTKLDGIKGNVVIRGMDLDGNLIYESHEFQFNEGNTYDLTEESKNYVLTTCDLSAKDYSFDVSVPSQFEQITLYFTASLYNGNHASKVITKEVTNGKATITSTEINDQILMSAGLFSSEYIFKTYDIYLYETLVIDENGKIDEASSTLISHLYDYDNEFNYQDSNDVDFYHKNYVITYKEILKTTTYYTYSQGVRLERNYGITNEVSYYLNNISSGLYIVSKNKNLVSIGLEDLVINNDSNTQLVFNKNGNKLLLGNITNTLLDETTYTNENLTITNEENYVGLVKIEEYRNGLEPGTYQVVYNGISYSYWRVEGPKQYFISNTEDGLYTQMQLVESNTNYEEYTISNYSVSEHIFIKDELGIIYGPYKNLEPGLYSCLNFSLDNQRRLATSGTADYEVFTNVKGTSIDEVTPITLYNGTDTTECIVYYLANDLQLPDYKDVFILKDGHEFNGWIDGGDNTYFAKLTYFVVIPDANGYILEYSGNRLYEDTLFKVIPSVGYSVSSVEIGKELTAQEDGSYIVPELTGETTLQLNVTLIPNTYNVTLVGNGGKYLDNGIEVKSKNAEIVFGKYGQSVEVPKREDGYTFQYYFDIETGVIVTDSKGNLLSPYMITKDSILGAKYTKDFTVIINTFVNGIWQSSTLKEGSALARYTDYIPKKMGYHYKNINAYVLSDNSSVSISMDEYQNLYSFVMPQGNVVINIDYEETIIKPTAASNTTTSLYVLLPLTLDKDVMIYDATISKYKPMTRLSDYEQIYTGFVAYMINDYDVNNKEILISTAYGQSYVYDFKNLNENLLVIDNIGLENEVGYFISLVHYDKFENEFRFTTDVDIITATKGDIHIAGKLGEEKEEVNIDGKTYTNVVTVTKAVNTIDAAYYQHATFEVVVGSGFNKINLVIPYEASGNEKNPIIINAYYDFYEYFNRQVISYVDGLYFKQTDDLDISDDNGYELVFSNNNKFNHKYNGNNYNISYIQNTLRDDINNGLFGYIGLDGCVSNLTVYYDLLNTNNIEGYETKFYVGAIASVNEGTILNVNTAINRITMNNVRYVGGLVGINAGEILDCDNNIAIQLYDFGVNYSDILGGIAGYNFGTISKCNNYAKQRIETNTNYIPYVGDIAGLDKYIKENPLDSNSKTITGIKDSLSYSSTIGDLYVVTPHMENGVVLKKITVTNNFGWSDFRVHYHGGKTSSEWPGINSSSNYFNEEYQQYIDEFYIPADSKCINITGKDNGNLVQSVDVDLDTNISSEFFYLAKPAHDYDTWYEVEKWGSGRDYTLNKLYKLRTFDGEDEQLIDLYSCVIENKIEFAAFNITMNVNQQYELIAVDSKGNYQYTLTGFDIASSESRDASKHFKYSNGRINCDLTGKYDLYFKFNHSKITTSNGSDSKALSNSTLNVIFVDDWWFEKQTISYNKNTYYLESAVKVDYYKGSTPLGSLVYTEDQLRHYNGMNNVYIDLLKDCTKIDISRVMYIQCFENAMERFYFSYDEIAGFAKLLGNEYKTYPNNTYTVNIDIDSNLPSNIYIYTTSSQLKYDTSGNKANKAEYLPSDASIYSYIDVEGLDEFDNYRVLYYGTVAGKKDTLIAIRSYNPGEQLELLSGYDYMIFEASYDGHGIKRIATIQSSDINGDVNILKFSSGTNSSSNHKLLLSNGKTINFVDDKNTPSQHIINSLSLSANSTFTLSTTIQITNVINNTDDYIAYDGSLFTVKTPYSFKFVLDENGKLTISKADGYELIHISGENENIIRLYDNPSPNVTNEIMATGIDINVGDTIQIRKINSSISNIVAKDNLEEVLTVSNKTVTFKQANTYDIYIDISDKNSFKFYAGQATAASYEFEPLNSGLSLGGKELTPSDVKVFEVKNFEIISCSDDDTFRVYYLDENGEILGYILITSDMFIDLDNDQTKETLLLPYSFTGTYYEIIDEVQVEKTLDVNASKIYITRFNSSDVLMNKISINAIYPTKTLHLYSNYYGYYDARWISDVDDRDFIYFDAKPNDLVYLNYVHNDGRTGKLLMKVDNGVHKLVWGSVIGLNPVEIWFTVEENSRATITSDTIALHKIDILNNNYYSCNPQNGELTVTPFRDYVELHVYIDENANLWHEYYLELDDKYYKMEQVSTRHYVSYVPLVDSKSFNLTSNPNLEYVKEETVLEEIIKISLTYSRGNDYYYFYGYDLDYIKSYNSEDALNEGKEINRPDIKYDYYLSGTVNGYASNNSQYGFIEYGSKYYLFLELSEEITYNITGTILTDLTLGSGYHMLVFNGSDKPTIYSNYLTYTIKYVYGDSEYAQYYKLGDSVEIPSDIVPSSSPTKQYTFEFEGWIYDGKLYKTPKQWNSESTNDKTVLVDEKGKELVVKSNLTLYPKYSPSIRYYNVELLSQNHSETDGYESLILSVPYGKKLVDFIAEIKADNKHEYYSELIALEKLSKNKENGTSAEGWFGGWYLTPERKVSIENYKVQENITIYAKWTFNGTYLTGVIDGYEEWDVQKPELRATLVTKNEGQQYELEHVYLKEGDVVKLTYFYADSNKDGGVGKTLYGNWQLSSAQGNCEIDNNKNIVIKTSGYYNFYLHWTGYEDAKEVDGVWQNEVWVSHQKYIVNYKENGQALTSGYNPYTFNFNGEDPWYLYTAKDSKNEIHAPSSASNDNVLFGWFTDATDGERVIALTKGMMDDYNSIVLYAHYIDKGYYVYDSVTKDIKKVTNDAFKVVANSADDLKLYYFEGSAFGSSAIANVLVNNKEVKMKYNNDITNLDNIGAYNTIDNFKSGIYYVYLDAAGKLCINQYHEVTYVLGPIGEISGVTKDRYSFEQKSGEALKVFNFVKDITDVTFLGWATHPGSTEMSYVTNVYENMTVYAIYRVGNVGSGTIPDHTCSIDSLILLHDDTHCWYQCSICGTITGKDVHDFIPLDKANDTHHYGICSICQYEGLVPHDYSIQKYDVDNHWNECVCGAIDSSSVTKHSPTAAGHKENYNSTQHWYVCAVCGQNYGHEDHSGGTPTFTEKATCSTCGVEYGSLVPCVTVKFSLSWSSLDSENVWCNGVKMKKEGNYYVARFGNNITSLKLNFREYKNSQETWWHIEVDNIEEWDTDSSIDVNMNLGETYLVEYVGSAYEYGDGKHKWYLSKVTKQ